MISNKSIIVMVVFILILIPYGCDQATSVQDNTPPLINQVDQNLQLENAEKDDPQLVPGRYVVVFNDQGGRQITPQAAEEAEQRIENVFSDLNIEPDSLIHKYKYALKGFAASLSEEQVVLLEADPRVDIVVRDVKYKATQGMPAFALKEAKIKRTDIVPWGVTLLYHGV